MMRVELVKAVSNALKALRFSYMEDKVSLKAEGRQLEVAAASTYMRVKTTLANYDGKDFEATVKASLLSQTLARMPEDDIRLELTPSGLRLSCDCANMVLPASDFIPVVTEGEYGDPIEVRDLDVCARQVAHALGDSNLHPMMGAVHLEVYSDGGIRTTALDGYRFSIRSTTKEDEPVSIFNIYGQQLKTALKMMDSGSETIQISQSINENLIRIGSSNLVVVLGLLNGDYYDVDKMKEKGFSIITELDLHEQHMLASSLELVKLVSRTVLLDVDENGITIAGQDALGSTRMKIPCKVAGISGAALRLAANVDYLADAVKGIADALQEIVSRAKSSETDSCLYISFKSPTSQICLQAGCESEISPEPPAISAIETVLPIRRKN